jgi:hypothetical protein
MGFCRDQTYLRWMERFGKRDAKSSMLAAVKYMQEVVKNDGATILNLVRDLVQEEQVSVLQMVPQFIGNMLEVELGWGGTCVTDPTTNEAVGCTSQMRAYGLCECLNPIKLLEKLSTGELMHVMWYLLLPYYEKRKGKWEIVEKEVFDQGCRSSGKEGQNTTCWTEYTVNEYGVVKTYGNNTCFLDDQKDPKCLKTCESPYLAPCISSQCVHFFWISSVSSLPLSHPPLHAPLSTLSLPPSLPSFLHFS